MLTMIAFCLRALAPLSASGLQQSWTGLSKRVSASGGWVLTRTTTCRTVGIHRGNGSSGVGQVYPIRMPPSAC